MIFIRFDGSSCQEGVDLRALDRAVAAIRSAHPGKAIRQIEGWTVLQWEPHVGAGWIRIQGGEDIRVEKHNSPSDDRRSQPFLLPAPGKATLVPDNMSYPATQVELDNSGMIKSVRASGQAVA